MPPTTSDVPWGTIKEHLINKFGDNSLNTLLWRDSPAEILAVVPPTETTIRVAADTGAVANVINPDDLPADCLTELEPDGTHFTGAGGGHIERYGEVDTIISSEHGRVGCNWQCADVNRALHSISTIAGPADGPAQHDVLFNNKVGVVVPPGFVEEILKFVKPIIEYQREGNLYVAEMTVSSFARQGRQE